MAAPGLRVLVQGELPAEQIARISQAVRAAVLRELAAAGLASTLVEKPVDDYVREVNTGIGSNDEPAAIGAGILAQLGLLTGVTISGFIGSAGPLLGPPGSAAVVPPGSSPAESPPSGPGG